MALNKKIELESGVITTYHRIVSIQNIINKATIIEVASYTTKAKRDEEKQALATAEQNGVYPEINVFIETEFIDKEYCENENIKVAYDYLKTTSKYKDAKDI